METRDPRQALENALFEVESSILILQKVKPAKSVWASLHNAKAAVTVIQYAINEFPTPKERESE